MSEENSRPESISELLPKQVYRAEILMLPFFWLPPLLVLFLGGSVARDIIDIKERFGVKPTGIRNLFYIIPLFLGHISSLTYRFQRRRNIIHELGFERSATYKKLEQHGGKHDSALESLAILQFLILLTLVAAPEFMISSVIRMAGLFILMNAVLGPLLVYRDLRYVRNVENFEWGRIRYAYILISALPLAVFVYLIQRQEHLYYTVLLNNWDARPEEFNLDEDEKNRLEEVTDRIDEKLPL